MFTGQKKLTVVNAMLVIAKYLSTFIYIQLLYGSLRCKDTAKHCSCLLCYLIILQLSKYKIKIKFA